MLRFLPDLTYWWRLVALRSSRMRGVHPNAIHFEREPLIPTDGAAQGATQQLVMRCVPILDLQQAVLEELLLPPPDGLLVLVQVEDLQHVVRARVPSKASHCHGVPTPNRHLRLYPRRPSCFSFEFKRRCSLDAFQSGQLRLRPLEFLLRPYMRHTKVLHTYLSLLGNGLPALE